jgi:uncharacterized iron-regulated protein
MPSKGGTHQGRNVSLRKFVSILILVILILGCTSSPPEVEPGNFRMVRPGIYMTNNIQYLPLPTSGYDLYLIGEAHGQTEVNPLFIEYLKRLHDDTGCQDILLEMSSAYEEEINTYISGGNMPWSHPWDSSYLFSNLRTLNMSDDSRQFRIHLVDVDYDMELVYKHLQNIKEKMGDQGRDIELPPFSEFNAWDQKQMLDLVNQLTEAANDVHLRMELSHMQYSVQFCQIFEKVGGHLEQEFNEISAIREEAMATRVAALLQERTPMIGLFGAWHVQKCMGIKPVSTLEEIPWTQRVVQLGIEVFSVYVGSVNEKGNPGDTYSIEISPEQFVFPDGLSLAAVLEENSEYDIVYVDLRPKENASATFGRFFSSGGVSDPSIPAEDVYDGIILFRN